MVTKNKAIELCNAFSDIYNMLRELQSMQIDHYKDVQRQIDMVDTFLNLKSSFGVLILSVFVNKKVMNGKNNLDTFQLQSFFKCELKDAVFVHEELTLLKAKRLIKQVKDDGEILYSLTTAALDAILKGDNLKIVSAGLRNMESFLKEINQILYMGANDDDEIGSAITAIMEDFHELKEVALISEYHLNDVDRSILLFMVLRKYIYGESKVPIDKIMRIALNDGFNRYFVQRELQENSSALLLSKLVKFSTNTNHKDTLELHTDFSNKITCKENTKTKKNFSIDTNLFSLTLPKDIRIQEGMVYEDESNIPFLEKILSEDGYIKVTKKLQNEGLGQKQVVAMLYGLSGTGKTQTVKNIAAKHNRPLIQVNISQIKDPYVGVSERNVQEVFRQYRLAVEYFEKQSKKLDGVIGTPILYIDEFESLMPQRTLIDGSPAGNMLSNMVAIFLTEIEKLEGILLLSTNIPSNIDDALHRRINFKFNFGSFKKANQKKVMELYFEELDATLIDEILSEFDLTPGNIVNIKKAFSLESIFNNYTNQNQIKQALLEITKRELILVKNLNPIGFMK